MCLPCGMQVDERTARFTSQHEGKTYYFCGPGCKRAFDADPERYLRGDAGEGHPSHHDHGHHAHGHGSPGVTR